MYVHKAMTLLKIAELEIQSVWWACQNSVLLCHLT